MKPLADRKRTSIYDEDIERAWRSGNRSLPDRIKAALLT